MPKGNFAASWVGLPNIELANFANLSFVSVLALHDALCATTPFASRLALKWPNDMLFDGGKLAGILLETTPSPAGHALIIGIGVNLAKSPESRDVSEAAHAPVALAEATGHVITPEELLDALASAFADRLAQFETEGFAPIRRDWRNRAAGIGREITARLTTTTHKGVFEDVDDTGALILRIGQERLVLPAADVYF